MKRLYKNTLRKPMTTEESARVKSIVQSLNKDLVAVKGDTINVTQSYRLGSNIVSITAGSRFSIPKSGLKVALV